MDATAQSEGNGHHLKNTCSVKLGLATLIVANQQNFADLMEKSMKFTYRKISREISRVYGMAIKNKKVMAIDIKLWLQ